MRRKTGGFLGTREAKCQNDGSVSSPHYYCWQQGLVQLNGLCCPKKRSPLLRTAAVSFSEERGSPASSSLSPSASLSSSPSASASSASTPVAPGSLMLSGKASAAGHSPPVKALSASRPLVTNPSPPRRCRCVRCRTGRKHQSIPGCFTKGVLRLRKASGSEPSSHDRGMSFGPWTPPPHPLRRCPLTLTS